MEIFKEKCSTQILLLRMVEIEEVHPEERAREEEKKANDRGGNGGDDGFRARTTGTRESAEDEEKEIIALATTLKSNGNEKFATSAFGEALKLYDDGVEVLSKEGECDDIDDSDKSDEDDGDVDETTTTTTTTKTKGTEKEEEDEANSTCFFHPSLLFFFPFIRS